MAFREHDQLRIGSTGVDRRQGSFEVVSRVIVTACQLGEFDFHGEFLVLNGAERLPGRLSVRQYAQQATRPEITPPG